MKRLLKGEACRPYRLRYIDRKSTEFEIIFWANSIFQKFPNVNILE
ncbi:MAG: hypothetical protein LBJ00_18385 [Planctomycetaceae bacterium]|nr:hypothetical protein [Planctomycetaceae bacterium]